MCFWTCMYMHKYFPRHRPQQVGLKTQGHKMCSLQELSPSLLSRQRSYPMATDKPKPPTLSPPSEIYKQPPSLRALEGVGVMCYTATLERNWASEINILNTIFPSSSPSWNLSSNRLQQVCKDQGCLLQHCAS